MSDTPRTDDALWTIQPEYDHCGNDPEDVVDADFARQLERELKESKDEWGEIADSLSMREAQLGDTLARVKVLEEALNSFVAWGDDLETNELADIPDLLEEARKALSPQEG